MIFLPRGFAQMAVIDLHDFNRQTYHFEYVRREFLGEVRCVVFDVTPLNRAQPGKFVGRIWADDRDFAVVRFNGTYVPAPPAKGAIPERFFHFDSWRVNVAPGEWAPAQIYIEEEPAPGQPANGLPRFKALREKGKKHPIEKVGSKLRAMMPWLKKSSVIGAAG